MIQLRNLTAIYRQPLLLLPSLNTHAQALLSLPHKAAQRTSELNFFLYLRISGLSLCGRIFVGLTLTTEPFLAFSLLTGSGFALDAEKDTWNKKINKNSSVWLHLTFDLFAAEWNKKMKRGETLRASHNQRKPHIWKTPHTFLSKHCSDTAAELVTSGGTTEAIQ